MKIFSLLFCLPIVAAAMQIMIHKSRHNVAAHMACCIFFVILSVYILLFNETLTVINLGNWPAPYGIVLVIDALSKLMLVVFAIVVSCISVFSLSDATIKHAQGSFYAATWLLVLSVIGALTTYDLFNLYVWAEVMLVSVFILLSISKNDNAINIWHYAILNVIGTLVILLAIALIYGMSGSLNMAAIGQYLEKADAATIIPIVGLLFLGFSIKGAIFPFYFWLPSSYPNTSASSTLLISSLSTKVIMLVMLRMIWLWSPIQSSILPQLFIILACFTMFLGVMGAANEYRLRHILSFHIISQLGYVFLALFIPTLQAIMAMLYFLIHNIFVKTNLLMTSGILEEKYQTNELVSMGGVLKACPILAVIFFLSAMSLAGVPPLSGFWGKLLIFKSAFDNQLYIALAFAVVVSLFTLYSMTKIWRYVYCEQSSLKRQDEGFQLNAFQLIALLPLLLLPLLMGLYPDVLLPTLHHIADQLSQPQTLTQVMLEAAR